MFLIDIDDVERSSDEASIDVPRYNIAPTQRIHCVVQQAGEHRRTSRARWGLVPSWADSLSIGSRMINARSETVDTKPSFRSAFAKRRCLIPTDGYYEWKKVDDGKQPFLIHRPDEGVMAMAGLWEQNVKASPDGQAVRSCTIITTDANATTHSVHDRMPVFVDASDFDQWLDPGFHDTESLKQLLRPAQDDLLRCDAVSRHVNNARNDDAGCIELV